MQRKQKEKFLPSYQRPTNPDRKHACKSEPTTIQSDAYTAPFSQSTHHHLSPITTSLPAPPRVPDLADGQSPIDVPIKHLLNQLDIRGRHDPRYAQFVVQYLVNAVKGVFLVDERVEEDAEGPNILFFAAVGFPLEDFGCGVI